VLVLAAAMTLAAGCATRKPAPVIDRLPPPAAKPAAPAVIPVPAAPAGPEMYTVKRGDTLYSIALDNGLDWRELAGLNGITDPSSLKVGQTLTKNPHYWDVKNVLCNTIESQNYDDPLLAFQKYEQGNKRKAEETRQFATQFLSNEKKNDKS
jgi:LysM repeat protein